MARCQVVVAVAFPVAVVAVVVCVPAIIIVVIVGFFVRLVRQHSVLNWPHVSKFKE